MAIPFAEINAAALSQLTQLVSEWFPAGKRLGHEYVVGDLSGNPGRSLSINLRTGRWADFAAGVGGSDPISLRAAGFHANDQGAAALDVARQVGITVHPNGHAGSANGTPRARTGDSRESEAPSWTSSTPPEDAPGPDLRDFSATWCYRSETGAVLRYVGRRNATIHRKKVYIPFTWGTLDGVIGWHKKHPDTPRCLYGLDRLAARPQATVIICEGEKAADAAQALFPACICMTWSAGTANVLPNDWRVLSRRTVVVWPDNDATGHKAAAQICEAVVSYAEHVSILRVDDLPEGADAADVMPDDPDVWLRERTSDFVDTRPNEDADQQEPETKSAGKVLQLEIEDHIISLGHDQGVYFYYSVANRQVKALTDAQHTRLFLGGLASETLFWNKSRFIINGSGPNDDKVDWHRAADWLRNGCRFAGIYDPDLIRGRGAWIDSGRSVLHLGDVLLVDGKASPLRLENSRFIYEAGPRLIDKVEPPLSDADAAKLLELCKAPAWQATVSGVLLAGWIVTAAICGGLKWRPSIWPIGAAQSGKSWLMDNIIRPALGKVALLVQSKTTEAGIRQALYRDARPVLFDEAEREDQQAASRMQGVLDLMRQSSSESGGEIIKGTQSGTAQRFRIRSAFCLLSINLGLVQSADKSRITRLGLRNRSEKNIKTDAEAFAELNRKAVTTLTPAYSAGLLARSVKLLPIIRANAETFGSVMAIKLGSRRAGDQFGALLAGAYSLKHSTLVTEDQAKTFIKDYNWDEEIEAKPERDEVRLLDHIRQATIRVSGMSRSMELTIGQLMRLASPEPAMSNGELPPLSSEHAIQELKEIGIKHAESDGYEGFWISNTSPRLLRILERTPWSAGHAEALVRLDGASKSGKASIRFSSGHVAKAVFLPEAAVFNPDPNAA